MRSVRSSIFSAQTLGISQQPRLRSNVRRTGKIIPFDVIRLGYARVGKHNIWRTAVRLDALLESDLRVGDTDNIRRN